MAARLICKIQFGIKNQTVYIQNEKYSGKKILETYQVPTSELAEFIANQKDVKNIYLSGGFTAFYSGIEKRVKEIEQGKYEKCDKVFVYDQEEIK